MKRNLLEAHNRFETAANIDIVDQWVSWSEYEVFVGHLNAVLKKLDSAAVNPELRNEINSYKLLRHAMRNTPLQPNEYFGQTTSSVGTSSVSGEIGRVLQKLRESVQELSLVNNPMRDALSRCLSGESIIKLAGSRSVQLLVPLKFVDDVNAAVALPSEPQRIIAMGTTTAKRSDLADVLFLFGAPENHASYFKDGIEKSREVAWIFNAPSARQVVIFQLADGYRFDSSNYEIWAGSNQFDSKSIGNRPSVLIENYEPVEKLDEIVTPPPLPGTPVVDASLVHLFGRRYIYFSDGIPPSAICVRDSEAGVEIDDHVRVSSLQPGDILLVRTGEASRLFLREHAIDWLLEHNDKNDVNKFFGVMDTYKNLLKDKFGKSDFINRLVREGLEEHYIKNQIERSFLQTAIATQSEENFLKISNALGLEYGDIEWTAIVKIQTAHREAGKIAVRELREAVLSNESWLKEVNEPGIATLNAGAAGEIVLIPVLKKLDNKVPVSIHLIGQLMSNG